MPPDPRRPARLRPPHPLYNDTNYETHHLSPGNRRAALRRMQFRRAGGLHAIRRSLHRHGRPRTRLHGRQRPVRVRTARSDEHPADMGLVLRLQLRRHDRHRVRPHAPERHGHRRPERHLADAGRRRSHAGTRHGRRSVVGHVVPFQPRRRTVRTGLLCHAPAALRHRRRVDRLAARRNEPLRLPRIGRRGHCPRPRKRAGLGPVHRLRHHRMQRPYGRGLAIFDGLGRRPARLLPRRILEALRTDRLHLRRYALSRRPLGPRAEALRTLRFPDGGGRAHHRQGRAFGRLGGERPAEHAGGVPRLGFRSRARSRPQGMERRVVENPHRNSRSDGAADLLHGALPHHDRAVALLRRERRLPRRRRSGPPRHDLHQLHHLLALGHLPRSASPADAHPPRKDRRPDQYDAAHPRTAGQTSRLAPDGLRNRLHGRQSGHPRGGRRPAERIRRLRPGESLRSDEEFGHARRPGAEPLQEIRIYSL